MEAPDGTPISRNVLIAVDESENARRAVAYVGSLLGRAEGFRATLLHVISLPEEDYFERAEQKEKWLEDHRRKAADFLERYRGELIAAGFDGSMVRVRSPQRHCPSIAECILEELDRSEYGTIVVGRQGLSRKEEFLFGSVSSKIVSHARNCAVWVVA
mgnify:CR=1 FL=1